MVPKIVTHPTGPLLSIETCRSHLEIVPIDGNSDGESHPDDTLILSMLGAAVEHAEEFLGMSLSIRTLEIALDAFPESEIILPKPPVIEIESVSYLDEDGYSDTLDPARYTLDDYQETPWLLPAQGTSWPATSAVVNAVKIRYVAGYASETDSDGDQLPQAIKAALLLMLGHLYNNREDSAEKAMSTIPNGFEALLRPRRIRIGMA